MRLPLTFIAIAAACVSHASTTYLGLYLQGHKIGYASYASTKADYNGRKVDRSDSRTIMDTGLLGTPLHIQMNSRTYTGPGSEPLAMTFDMESQGRRQSLRAEFAQKDVTISIDNSGIKSKRVLAKPDGPVVDDPMTLVLKGKNAVKCYVLDPTTVSFVPNEVRLVGKKKEQFDGKSVLATIVDIEDPRATTRAYLSASGDLLRAEGPLGIVMKPETAAVAMKIPGKYSPDVDLAYSTSIRPEGDLDNPAGTTELKLSLTGRNLSSVPSDETQSVAGGAGAWTIDIHPPKFEPGSSIADAAKDKPDWTKSDLDMPSDSTEFKNLSHEIVGDRKLVGDAASAIKDWVYEHMKPNAGIGVLRDAGEVLKTKEGVCRDYAILTGTLLRSAGIPTRLCSGLVDWDGTFYYHAWDEVWDGSHWIGIDSTTPDRQVSAAHVKLADGSVAQAFTFAVLDKVKIKILSARSQ